MASEFLVLTAIGPDRPGLVEALSEAIAAHGANWLESRMARLGGQFAGLLRVSVPGGEATSLRAALAALEPRGLRVVVESSEAPSADPDAASLHLELVGLDRPGIVHEIAQTLTARRVNVEELESHTSSAPMSGETLFHARATLRVPFSDSHEELRETLEKLADELMVDLTLADPPRGPRS